MSHWNFSYLELHSDSAVELIDAKQALAGDLCPLRPPAHYFVTNVAEDWLKPLTAPHDEMTVEDDEATAEHG